MDLYLCMLCMDHAQVQLLQDILSVFVTLMKTGVTGFRAVFLYHQQSSVTICMPLCGSVPFVRPEADGDTLQLEGAVAMTWMQHALPCFC